jgi:hypothetical protein
LAVLKMSEAMFLSQMTRDMLEAAREIGGLKWWRVTPKPQGHILITRESLVRYMRSMGIPLDISLQGASRRGTPPEDFDLVRKRLEKEAS